MKSSRSHQLQLYIFFFLLQLNDGFQICVCFRRIFSVLEVQLDHIKFLTDLIDIINPFCLNLRGLSKPKILIS